MTRKEQKEFVTKLCENLRNDLIRKIESEKIPEKWDGMQLREYLKDQVTWRKLDRKQRREYNNDLMVNPL